MHCNSLKFGDIKEKPFHTSEENGFATTATSVVSKYTVQKITIETMKSPKEIYCVSTSILTWYVFLVTKSNHKFHCINTDITVDNHQGTLVYCVLVSLDLDHTVRKKKTIKKITTNNVIHEIEPTHLKKITTSINFPTYFFQKYMDKN